MPLRRPLRTDTSYTEYVKDFYRAIEDYDWNAVADKRVGLESILHRKREVIMKRQIARFGKGNEYLDVGCGTGLILRHLPSGATGIDINPRHIARAKKYVPSAHILEGDAEHIPFPDNSFSTIICTEVLEHLVHPDTALSEMYRVLKTGGMLIGSTPRHALLWRLRFLSSTHYHNEPFHNEYAKRELENLFQDWTIRELQARCFYAMYFFVLEKK